MRAILTELKGGFARLVIGRWKELDAPVLHRIRQPNGRFRFWQMGGGYDRNVRDEAELFEKIGYIHNNPVQRGLVGSPLDWRWSSARWYAGHRETSPIAIDAI